MSELICDRDFTVNVDGVPSRMIVEWMKPHRSRGDWRCDFTLHWVGRDAEHGYSMGVDSTQALLLAMDAVRMRMEDEAPDAFWLDSGAGLGLPPLPADSNKKNAHDR